MDIGDFIGDAARLIEGNTGLERGYPDVMSGPFWDSTPSPRHNVSDVGNGVTLMFTSSRVVPTAHEFRSASISVLTCISY